MILRALIQADTPEAAHILRTLVFPFVDLLECAGLARVCKCLRLHAGSATMGPLARALPQRLSVVFNKRVGCAADLEILLYRFPYITLLEMSQRQMLRTFELSEDDEDEDSDFEVEADSDSCSDAEDFERTVHHSCNVRRARFHACFRWLMSIESVRTNLQELHIVDVRWDIDEGLYYTWSGRQIDHRSSREQRNIRRKYVRPELSAAEVLAWRKERGLLPERAALRVFSFHSNARHFSAKEVHAIVRLCPELEIFFLAPHCSWKLNDDALQALGNHCLNLRVVKIETYGCPRISADGLLALPLASIEGLFIGGIRMLRGSSHFLKALCQATHLKELEHSLDYSDDETIPDNRDASSSTRPEPDGTRNTLDFIMMLEEESRQEWRAFEELRYRRQWYWRDVWHPTMLRRGVQISRSHL